MELSTFISSSRLERHARYLRRSRCRCRRGHEPASFLYRALLFWAYSCSQVLLYEYSYISGPAVGPSCFCRPPHVTRERVWPDSPSLTGRRRASTRENWRECWPKTRNQKKNGRETRKVECAMLCKSTAIKLHPSTGALAMPSYLIKEWGRHGGETSEEWASYLALPPISPVSGWLPAATHAPP